MSQHYVLVLYLSFINVIMTCQKTNIFALFSDVHSNLCFISNLHEEQVMEKALVANTCSRFVFQNIFRYFSLYQMSRIFLTFTHIYIVHYLRFPHNNSQMLHQSRFLSLRDRHRRPLKHYR